MTELIFQARHYAHSNGELGLTPARLAEWVRGNAWNEASVSNVGPIAWRMWKRGQLGKEGSRYFRNDRELHYPERHKAPTSELMEAS